MVKSCSGARQTCREPSGPVLTGRGRAHARARALGPASAPRSMRALARVQPACPRRPHRRRGSRPRRSGRRSRSASLSATRRRGPGRHADRRARAVPAAPTAMPATPCRHARPTLSLTTTARRHPKRASRARWSAAALASGSLGSRSTVSSASASSATASSSISMPFPRVTDAQTPDVRTVHAGVGHDVSATMLGDEHAVAVGDDLVRLSEHDFPPCAGPCRGRRPARPRAATAPRP